MITSNTHSKSKITLLFKKIRKVTLSLKYSQENARLLERNIKILDIKGTKFLIFHLLY